MKEAESLEASVREKKARKKLEDAEARAAAHQAEVESKMGEIQAMRTSHSHRLLEHRGATEKLEAEAAENLQEITKRYNDRLLNGTINRIMRQQIAAGWNKWVDSSRQSRLAAGLSKHLEAHMKELETQQLAYASDLEKALAAHEADKEKELRAKMLELDELSASRISDSEVMQRRITELEGGHADRVSELMGTHADMVSELVGGHADKVSELEAAHVERIAAVESNHAEVVQRRITELEDIHADRVSELGGGYANKVSELEAANVERVATVESDIAGKVAELESSHVDQVNQLEATHANTVAAHEAAHASNIASQAQEHSEILKAAQGKHAAAESAHIATKAEHEVLLKTISQQHDDAMRELKETHEKAQEGMLCCRALVHPLPWQTSRSPPLPRTHPSPLIMPTDIHSSPRQPLWKSSASRTKRRCLSSKSTQKRTKRSAQDSLRRLPATPLFSDRSPPLSANPRLLRPNSRRSRWST